MKPENLQALRDQLDVMHFFPLNPEIDEVTNIPSLIEWLKEYERLTDQVLNNHWDARLKLMVQRNNLRDEVVELKRERADVYAQLREAQARLDAVQNAINGSVDDAVDDDSIQAWADRLVKKLPDRPIQSIKELRQEFLLNRGLAQYSLKQCKDEIDAARERAGLGRPTFR